jgi:hypothetical protein
MTNMDIDPLLSDGELADDPPSYPSTLLTGGGQVTRENQIRTLETPPPKYEEWFKDEICQ